MSRRLIWRRTNSRHGHMGVTARLILPPIPCGAPPGTEGFRFGGLRFQDELVVDLQTRTPRGARRALAPDPDHGHFNDVRGGALQGG